MTRRISLRMSVSTDILFQPIALGTTQLTSRVVRTAHGTGMAVPHITDRFIDYFVARADGGCALSIIEASRVHPSTGNDLQLYGDQIVPGYRRLMKALRPYDMRVFQQLFHGGNVYPAADGGTPWAVSDIAGPWGIVGRPMGQCEINELVESFASAAQRAQEGELDGVEIQGAHSYIIQQFLSPYYNNREDQYGGSLENRCRFLLEVARAVRSAVARGFTVGVRLSPGPNIGVTAADCKQALELLQREKLIDYVNLSYGDHLESDNIVGGMHHPPGYQLASSTQIGSIASVPRIVTGRFRTLGEAAGVIHAGKADLVSLVRATIADADLVKKTREGRAHEIRPCIACNQGCIGGLIRGEGMRCAVNPAVGRERELSESNIRRSELALNIVVAGGGPAGMEAARVAALHGHRVTLFEAQGALGGTVALAQSAPNLRTLSDITQWLEREIRRLGVICHVNTRATESAVRALRPDAVVVATGSVPRKDALQPAMLSQRVAGAELPHVLSSRELLTQTSFEGAQTALVLDTVGHYEALACVEILIEQGISVTYLTPATSITPYLQTTWRDRPALQRFYRRGSFTALTRHGLLEIQHRACWVRPLDAEDSGRTLIAADRVILVTHNRPVTDLYEALRGEWPVFLVGDANAPRDIQAAIREGHLAGRSAATLRRVAAVT